MDFKNLENLSDLELLEKIFEAIYEEGSEIINKKKEEAKENAPEEKSVKDVCESEKCTEEFKEEECDNNICDLGNNVIKIADDVYDIQESIFGKITGLTSRICFPTRDEEEYAIPGIDESQLLTILQDRLSDDEVALELINKLAERL